MLTIDNSAIMGLYWGFNAWESYVDSGITRNQTYHVSGRLLDRNGDQIDSSSSTTLTVEPRYATGTITDIIVNNDGTFSFTYQSDDHGPSENNYQDDFYLVVNGVRTSKFWTNSY